MCSPASFVLTKDEVFWSRKSDSHEDIIDEFKIHVDGVRGPNAVRVEVTPPNGDMTKPLKEWEYHLDQRDYPKWYDSKDAETRARKALVSWAKAKLIVVGEAEVRDGQVYACDSSQVKAYGSSRVKAYSSSQVKAYSSSQVYACGSSRVTAYDSSQVKAYGSSRVTGCEHHATVSHYSRTEPCKPTGKYAVVIDRRGDRAVCVVGE